MFEELFYITQIGNLDSIIQRGILSRGCINQAGGSAHDISDRSVQEWRRLPEPVFKRPINSYAPLYINPKNPMLRVVQNRHTDLVILGVSPDVLSVHQHLFTDGNAACHNTRFSTAPDILAESLPALKARYWNDYPEGRRRRMAEVLVFPAIEARFLTRAFCQCPNLAESITEKHGLKTVANSGFFF